MSTQVAAPPESREFEPQNRLLAALSRADLLDLRPHLEPLDPEPGSILLEADEPLARVYFVETGVVSLVTVLEDRGSAGVAMVGREGLIGITTLLGGETALGRHLVHVPGSVLALEISRFRSALQATPELRAACEAYARAFFFQVLHAAACYRLHTLEQRCARWLLMCADRTEDAGFQLTQERLAEMLGVRRPTVTAIAHTLQDAGLICGRRGAFQVLDRRGLEAAACECYRMIRNHCERPLARPVS